MGIITELAHLLNSKHRETHLIVYVLYEEGKTVERNRRERPRERGIGQTKRERPKGNISERRRVRHRGEV